MTDQIDQYNEILDKLDEALAELNKADRDFDLTDIQGQSVNSAEGKFTTP